MNQSATGTTASCISHLQSGGYPISCPICSPETSFSLPKRGCSKSAPVYSMSVFSQITSSVCRHLRNS